jgi:hypothetical protein
VLCYHVCVSSALTPVLRNTMRKYTPGKLGHGNTEYKKGEMVEGFVLSHCYWEEMLTNS